MEDARAVARHRRAIRALREAERTGYLRHVVELGNMLKSGLLLLEVLPGDFPDRLNNLRLERKRGRPVRSIFRSLEIRELFAFFRTADLAIFDRFGVSKRQEKAQKELNSPSRSDLSQSD
jgi:hypothetical protein